MQSCEGIYIEDLQGRRYMDFHGNNVHQVGFSNPDVIAAIKKQLDEKGHVAIYGILFDVDKASLKPESQKPLQEIVKLMRNYPDLKLEVQGHTDNQGSADYNRDLSQRRAETVKTY